MVKVSSSYTPIGQGRMPLAIQDGRERQRLLYTKEGTHSEVASDSTCRVFVWRSAALDVEGEYYRSIRMSATRKSMSC